MDRQPMDVPAELPCLVNGVPTRRLSVRDRGLAYGDGVFETIRVVQGRATLRRYHFQRLARSVKRLRIPLNLQVVEQEVDELAAEIGEGVLKLIVTRGDSQRGYAIPEPQQTTRILQAAPLPAYPAEHAQSGVHLYPCTTQLGHQPLLAGLKHLNRLEQVLARSEWQDTAYPEGLMCDLAGHPIEGTMSNIFVRMDGRWITPALDQCGVAGVMRDFLIDQLGGQQQLTVGSISREALLDSEEVFCCNSVFGVWPVVGLGSHRWPVGPHTRHAQALAEQVIN